MHAWALDKAYTTLGWRLHLAGTHDTSNIYHQRQPAISCDCSACATTGQATTPAHTQGRTSQKQSKTTTPRPSRTRHLEPTSRVMTLGGADLKLEPLTPHVLNEDAQVQGAAPAHNKRVGRLARLNTQCLLNGTDMQQIGYYVNRLFMDCMV